MKKSFLFIILSIITTSNIGAMESEETLQFDDDDSYSNVYRNKYTTIAQELITNIENLKKKSSTKQ